MIRKILFVLILLLLFIALSYFIGPKPTFESFSSPKSSYVLPPLDGLEAFVNEREMAVKNLKPDNEARIIWAEANQQKTKYAVVYLHGFSASPMEGDPTHLAFAKEYGANMYLARLDGHGIASEDAFLDISPAKMMEDAREAVAIGKLLGEQVVIMAASTGATLAAYIAAEDPSIHSLFFTRLILN